MVRTKKVKASGKFGAGYGTNVRAKFVAVESKQRKKQKCPFCNSKIFYKPRSAVAKIKTD